MPTTAATHSTEPGALRWYRWLVWAGIVSNIVVSVVSIIYPAEVLAFVGVDPATPLIWPRLAVMLLALLSIFYIPAALDPCAHPFLGGLRCGVPVCRHDLLRRGGRALHSVLSVRLCLRRAAGDLSLSRLAANEGGRARCWCAGGCRAGQPACCCVLFLECLSVADGTGRAGLRVRRGAFQIWVDRQRRRHRHSVSDLGRHAGGLRPPPAASAGLRRVRSALRTWTESDR